MAAGTLSAAAWGAAAALLSFWMLPLEPSLLEEGYVVHFAQRIADGERLYRDLVTFTGPLPYEALALLFRIFGDEISVARGAVAVLQGLAAAAVFDLARRGGAGALAHLAGAAVACAPVLLFPLMSIFFYATLAYLLTLLTGWAAVRAFGSTGFAVAAGSLVAAVALCKQTVGLTLAPALLGAVAVACTPESRTKRLAGVVAGGAGVAILVVATYGLRGDLGALVRSLVDLPLSLESSFSSPFVNFWPPGEFAPQIRANVAYYLPQVLHLLGDAGDLGHGGTFAVQALYGLPILAFGLTLTRAAAGVLSGAGWIHTAVLVALASNLYPRSDWGHLIVVLPPSLVQICLVARPGGLGTAGRWVAVTATVALMGSVGAVGLGLHRLAGPASFGPRVAQRPVSALYRGPELPAVIRFLRESTEPGEAIFVARMEPLLYFATQTRNPTPFGGVIPAIRDEQERAILAGLEQVRFVVMSDLDRPVFTYYRDELPAVQAALERHFRVAPGFENSWIVVLERGPDRGATAVDLIEALPDARLWIRDAGGEERLIGGEPPRLSTQRNRRPLPFGVGAGGGGVDYELEIPPGARFEADAGIRVLGGVSGTMRHAIPVDLVVAIAEPGAEDDAFVQLASVVVDEYTPGEEWIPVEVDLSRYAGQRMVLRLEAVPRGVLSPLGLAWWGSPRLVVDP